MKLDTDYRAFVTGSHAYGTPTKDSDVDVCILANCSARKFVSPLLANCDEFEDFDVNNYGLTRGVSVKIGKLNLLVFSGEVEFFAWRDATAVLKSMAPVTRETAIEVIDSFLIEYLNNGNRGSEGYDNVCQYLRDKGYDVPDTRSES